MITLISGLPGNGKTLFALWYIKTYAESENREVFYSGIKGLMLPWTEFDPQEWMALPTGSIIVIDEAQFVFPKKPNGSKLPEYYEQLATHRHRGFDIFLITQHPSLVDGFVRKLIGRHFHAIRKFGLQRNTIYEWSAANDQPEKQSSQKTSITMKWKFRKEVYGWYTSAEVHTVKRSIPAKLILALLFVAAVIGAGMFTLKSFQSRTDRNQVDQHGGLAAPGLNVGGQAAVFDPVADAKHFLQMNTPRIAGLQHTAPKYDEITKPTAVPIPAMCIQHGAKGEKCECKTQQATPLEVPFNMCIEFARNGFFREFDPEADRARQERMVESLHVLASREVEAGGQGGQVSSFAVPAALPAHQPLSGTLATP